MLRLNGTQVTPTIFPDQTSQVWKLNPNQFETRHRRHTIQWEFSHEGEFLQLSQLVLLLRNVGCRTIKLELKYLPYGRQDKAISNDATFALRVFAHHLNYLKLDEVVIMDPHSEEALRLIYNSKAVYPKSVLQSVILDTTTTLACYPDKGAVSKYVKVYDHEIGDAYIYGEKVRDQLTGNITHYELIGDCRGKSVLIVDDICDGGMTFKILAKDLLAKGAIEVNLFVTHGIFSRGLKTLKDAGINRIFTQDGEASEVQNHITYRTL